jgi:predicted nucleic acid-binding protein
MFTIDTSVFARDLDSTGPAHTACRLLLDELDVGGVSIFSPTLLLAELAATISRTRRDVIHARVVAMSLRDLPYLTLLTLDDHLAWQAAELAADFRLRGADAVFLAFAQRTATALVTLDVEQRTRAARSITTYPCGGINCAE